MLAERRETVMGPQDSPHKRKCMNCASACSGPFCCEWCLDAFLQRNITHVGSIVGRKRQERLKPGTAKPRYGLNGQ